MFCFVAVQAVDGAKLVAVDKGVVAVHGNVELVGEEVVVVVETEPQMDRSQGWFRPEQTAGF